ncbi:bifunctional phosphoribosyl-AMP cyclohydrolase/phosphoribosyl-ATP diphosphatase HisIE [Clostridium tetanomorphum]|uniref:Histidine biosynthesis bifunctional protein HisIE n=1 Tax=Clostridium tetanomorphum TaxID=1553 RepID=A0A923EAM5_CLOTT|nr:bifunctional phosphoribosyl-AMP cyclohydrolase/phosphoribosyl-ATP diphosphatase HisIE [Clostridium tetanomorphum]MBC2399722.1 bifunctional phosphoribosyl-AMP cyclohydrolase/phosphoribosyl-ATP diphosphatase HisIE [Clostridium tetanomorphum]NRZ97952.1 phosphoribosyl-ATP pyrophosphohydrolase/phosphoribosyl-AMP cyclohydrolase [Clostridium tetanomorphum]
MKIKKIIEEIKFDTMGLVPAIVQDINTNKVLMLAYMNEEAIRKTLEERVAHYYSRSRKKLWKKGETSGNIQKIKGFYYDCDKDTILISVEQIGVACHTGNYSCFFNEVIKEESEKGDVLQLLYSAIRDRKNNPKEGSYTNYLFQKGLDKILKKVGEETSEVIIGAKNKSKEELVYEISDLVYHLLVLMINEEVTIEDIKNELYKRKK